MSNDSVEGSIESKNKKQKTIKTSEKIVQKDSDSRINICQLGNVEIVWLSAEYNEARIEHFLSYHCVTLRVTHEKKTSLRINSR